MVHYILCKNQWSISMDLNVDFVHLVLSCLYFQCLKITLTLIIILSIIQLLVTFVAVQATKPIINAAKSLNSKNKVDQFSQSKNITIRLLKEINKKNNSLSINKTR